MEKQVLISIRGTQQYEDTGDDTIDLTTVGTLSSRDGGGYHLTYHESEVTGLAGTVTDFEIGKRWVILSRTGTLCSQMVFQTGRRHTSHYNTPYGAMEVGVCAKSLRSTIGDNGGELDIDYTIEVDHALAGNNAFHIIVTEHPEEQA